ncbi:MAG: hypothetical protein U0166_27055 [Acidobacteriota bacterium]
MIFEARFALLAAILIAFVVPVAAGALALRLCPLPRRLRIALAYPVGAALTYGLELAALATLPPDVGPYIAILALFAIALAGVLIGRAAPDDARGAPDSIDAKDAALSGATVALLLVTGAQALAGAAGSAQGLEALVKARHLGTFGVDSAFFHRPSVGEPIFAPLHISWIGMASGVWSARPARLHGLLMLASTLLAIGCFLRDRGHSRLAAAGLVGLLAAAPALRASVIAGAPALPCACGIVLAAIFLHRSSEGSAPDLLFAGVFAGLAAAAGTDGLMAMPAAVALAARAISRSSDRRRALAAFTVPAALLAIPWPALLALHGIPITGDHVVRSPARAAAYLLRDALFSAEGTGRPDDWLLLLPVALFVIAVNVKRFLESRAALFAGLALWLAIAAVARAALSATEESFLADVLPFSLLPIMTLLFLSMATTLSGRPATMEGT